MAKIVKKLGILSNQIRKCRESITRNPYNKYNLSKLKESRMKTYNNCWITIQGNCFTTMFIYSSKKTENNCFYDYYNLSKSHQKQEITRPKTFLRRKLFISFRLPCIVTNKYLNPKHRLSIYLRIEDLTYVFVCSSQILLLM